MLLSKKVTIKWNGTVKKHYIAKGYEFTKIGETFEVNVDDLMDGATAIVNVKCDYCGKPYEMAYKDYVNKVRDGIVKKCACKSCLQKKAREAQIIRKTEEENKLPIKEMIRLYESGLSAKKVGEQLGYSEAVVFRRLKAAGVKKRKNNGKDKVASDLISKEQIEEMIANGKTQREMDEIFGLTKGMAAYLIKKYDIEYYKETLKDRLSKKLLEQLRKNGVHPRDIAEMFDCSQASIYNLMMTYDIERREQRPLVKNIRGKLTKEILFDLWVNQKKSQPEIAEVFDCSDGTVGNLIREYGIVRTKSEISKEILEELYIKQDHSIYQISEILQRSSTNVHWWMDKFGIRKEKVPLKQILTTSLLTELYYVKDKTVPEIAKEFDSSEYYIYQLFREYKLEYKHDIKLKEITPEKLYELHYEKELNYEEIGELFDLNKNVIYRLMKKYGIEGRTNYKNLDNQLSKEELEYLYIDLRKNIGEIAEIYDCTAQSILYHMDRQGIERRSNSESQLHPINFTVTREQLYEWYVTQDIGSEEICMMLGGVSTTTLRKALRRFDIPIKRAGKGFELAEFGMEFEEIVKEVLELLFENIIYNSYVSRHNADDVLIRPDFQIGDTGTWMDAKLSSHAIFHSETLNRYLPHPDCKELWIIYLRGRDFRSYLSEPKVKLVPIDSWYSDLVDLGRKDLIEKLEDLRKRVNEL